MNRVAAILLVIGTLYVLRDRIPLPFPLFRLPGDLLLRGERFHVFLPVTTSLLISLVVSLALALIARRE